MEIIGYFEVFYFFIVVGGLIYYFIELLQIKFYNVLLYDRMFCSYNLKFFEGVGVCYYFFVEIMDGFYFDGKEVDILVLFNYCIICSIYWNCKNLFFQG